MLVNLSCDVNFSYDATHNYTGNTSYDPECNHYYAFKVLKHNINELTHQDELDQCGDETSMGHEGCTEPRSGISSIIMNKTGVTNAHRLSSSLMCIEIGCDNFFIATNSTQIFQGIEKSIGLLLREGVKSEEL